MDNSRWERPLVALLLFILLIHSLSCANDKPEVHTTLPANAFITDDSHISISVLIDSLSFNFLFDTGACGKLIVSDTVASILGITDSANINSKMGYGFSPYPPLKVKKMTNSSLDVTIGGMDLFYDEVIIDNSIAAIKTDGIISIPKGDKHVWNLDFDRMRLVLSDSLSASLASECVDYIFDLYEYGGNYFIKDLPMTFVSDSSGKAYHYINDYMIDTGSPYEIVLMGKGGHKGNYEQLTDYLTDNSFNFEYIMRIGKEAFHNNMYYISENRMVGDTVQVIDQRISQSGLSINILGMGFIYRYNVIIDLQAKKLLLKKREPSKNLGETVLSIYGANMDTYTTTGHTNIVTCINPCSVLYQAGIRRFDEITWVTGKSITGNSSKIYKMAEKGDTVYFTIIRNGDKLHIPVVK